jgi:hypothetical protein
MPFELIAYLGRPANTPKVKTDPSDGQFPGSCQTQPIDELPPLMEVQVTFRLALTSLLESIVLT